MNKIDFTVGQAAGVAVMPVNADATLTNSSGGASVFAGVVVARRGAPGKVLYVTASNYKDVLGAPIHPRMGATFEPYRHVERAVKGGNGYLVRACAPDMKIPGIAVSPVIASAPEPAEIDLPQDEPVVKSKVSKKTATAKSGLTPVDSDENAVPVTSVTATPDSLEVAVGDEIQVIGDTPPAASTQSVTFAPYSLPAVPEGALGVFYIKDGDASVNRTLSLEPDEGDLFTLTLTEILSDGTLNVLETHQLSFNPEAVTDMGQPAWIPTVLDGQSTRLGAVLASDAQDNAAGIYFTDVAFEDGTDGDLSAITSADYTKALEVLEESPVNYTALLSLGCYDPTVIAAINQLALDVRVDMFYDVGGNQTPDSAIQEAASHGLGGSHQPCRYYFPFSCRDTFTSMNIVYGISCDAFVAKARGVALVPDIGGWHYSPAGLSRAIIDRQNITKIPNLGVVDREAFVKARINPVTVASDGSVYIDDALTTYVKNNYLRFQHVSSLMDAISRGFYDVAQSVKHEPDGLTQKTLNDAMTNLLDRFYAADALVTPRDPTEGTAPYIVTVKQADFDFWQVDWAVCPTGTARRIVGKPILMR
jgi:hypothetical protein